MVTRCHLVENFKDLLILANFFGSQERGGKKSIPDLSVSAKLVCSHVSKTNFKDAMTNLINWRDDGRK